MSPRPSLRLTALRIACVMGLALADPSALAQLDASMRPLAPGMREIQFPDGSV